MVIVLFQQQKKALEEKIKDLHQNMEGVLKELDKANEEMASIRKEKDSIQKERSDILGSVKEAKVMFKKWSDLVLREEEKYRGIVKEQESYVIRSSKKVSDLNDEEFRLANSLRIYSKKAEELDEICKETSKQKKILLSVEQEIERGEKIILKRLDDISKEESVLSEKKSLVESLIIKHGKILTKTEQNLSLIYMYAKRLQKRYNELGMKVDLLSKFNLNSNEE